MAIKPTDPFAEAPYPLRAPNKSSIPGLRLGDPKVREHVARVVLKHQMDYEAACGKMLPAKATKAQIIALAQTLESDPRIQAELQEQLRKLGIDDESFKEFYSTLWYWLKDRTNDRRFAVASRILGEAFGVGARKDASKTPSELKIAGFEAGVKRMFQDASPPATMEEEILQ